MVDVVFSLLINFKAWIVIARTYKQNSTYLPGICVQPTICLLKSGFDQCPVNTVQMNNLQKLQNHLFGKFQIHYQRTSVYANNVKVPEMFYFRKLLLLGRCVAHSDEIKL